MSESFRISIIIGKANGTKQAAQPTTPQNINQNGNNNKPKQVPQRNGRMDYDDSEEDPEAGGGDDSEEGGLSEDEKFVSNFLNVRKNKLQSPGMDFHTKVVPTLEIPVRFFGGKIH